MIIDRIQNMRSWYIRIVDKRPYGHAAFWVFFATLLMVFLYREVSIPLDVNWENGFTFVDVNVNRKSNVQKKSSEKKREKELDENQFEKNKNNKDWEEAVDMAFQSDNQLPRLLYPLKKIYPKYSKDKEVEATILVEILINKDGIVKDIKIRGIQLSKLITLDEENLFKLLFVSATKRMLLAARYTRPLINKKNQSIRMEFPLAFRLED